MSLDAVFRGFHIAAGGIALGSMWIPMFAKKGGLLHRRAGWVYAVAMWVAALFAWVVCAGRLLDQKPANDHNALFLAFVGLLAANNAAVGVRVLRSRGRTDKPAGALDVAMSALLLVGSVGLAVLGVTGGRILDDVFAALGVFLSLRQLRFWLRPPALKQQWWLEHMGNMLASCIGTATAFLVVNAGHLGLSGPAVLVVWIAPGVVGAFGIRVWTQRYRKRFTKGAA